MDFLQHCWGLILLICIIMGPIPCSLILALPSSYQLQNHTSTRIPLALFTTWSILQICIGLLAGMVSQLHLGFILLLEAATFLFGIVILHAHKNLIFSDLKKYLPRKEKFSKFEFFILGSLLFATCVLLEQLATHPIIDYDSLWYHLPTMARWYQEGMFVRLAEFASSGSVGADQVTYYPYNWEVLCMLFFMPFQEDFLIALPNLLVWLMFGLAIYSFSIDLGVVRIYGLAFAALVLMIPLIMQHVNSMHIDLPFATFFMISLCFAISYHKTRFNEDLVFFGASLCLLLGIKASAVAYVIVPVLMLLVVEIKRYVFNGKNRTPGNQNESLAEDDLISSARCKLRRVRLLVLFLIAFGSLYLGGFWYLKNLIDIGNPLGNVKIQIGNMILFPGSIDLKELNLTSLIYLFKINNLSHWMIFILQFIVRLQLPFVVMISQLFMTPFVILTNKGKIWLRVIIGSLILLFSTGYLYWKTPYTGTSTLPTGPITSYVGQQVRFAMTFFALLGVNAGIVATNLQIPRNIVVIVVLTSSILGVLSITVFELMQISSAFQGKVGWASKILDDFRINPSESVRQIFGILGNDTISLAIYIFLYIIFICIMAWLFKRITRRIPVFPNYDVLSQHSKKLLIISILAIALISYTARDKRELKRQEIYGDIYQYISTDVKKVETIGYVYSHRSYLFYGKNWHQKVLSISPYPTDLSKWLHNLKNKQISVVATGPLEEQFGWRGQSEIPWLQNIDGAFVKVFGQDPEHGFVLYRLKSE
jgi:hypothetical protein